MDISYEAASQLSPKLFLEKYFLPEIPVIITDTTKGWGACNKWDSEYLLEKFLKNNTEVDLSWFQSNTDFLSEDIIMPSIVNAVLNDSYSYLRNNKMRFWVNYQNNITYFHADYNGLFVFNVQVVGKKKWQIIHPDAPIKLYSFTQAPYLNYNKMIPDSLRTYLCEFDLNQGDMLFLPPYWYHKVISMEPVNINVNWVGTKKIQKNNALHLREKELMKCLLPLSAIKPLSKLIDYFMAGNVKNYFDNYAGNAGKKYLKQITQEISYTTSFKRLFTELIKMPILFKDSNKLRNYVKINPITEIKKKLNK